MGLFGPEVAEVVLSTGRFHLVVRGVYVAMEGDVCRDPLYSNRWSEESLRHAAQLINNKVWNSAAHRYKNPNRMEQ